MRVRVGVGDMSRLDKSLSAPVSARGLFGGDSSDSDGGAFDNEGEETSVLLAGCSVRVRQRPFHPLHANAVWPGAVALAEWAAAAEGGLPLLRGRRCLELGAATGAFAVFAVRSLGLDITTSDVDDGEVEAAVAETFALNGLPPCPHAPHTWGTLPLPPALAERPFDVILASDILLYVRAYPALVDTLEALCAPREGHPVRHT